MSHTLSSVKPQPYAVSLAGFEGPLDLLLHLVEQAKLDITAISLVQVTEQYLVYLRAADRIDHRALADFIAIGARLLELKSRALLPMPPAPPPEDEEEDPGDLVALLREYKRFQEVAALLKEREETGLRAFSRQAQPPDVPPLAGLGHVTLDRLAAIALKALARMTAAAEPAPLKRASHSVRQKIAEIELLLRLSGSTAFGVLIERCHSREEIITVFLAVLELIKLNRLVACQDTAFGEIALRELCGRDLRLELESEFVGIQQAAGV